MDERYRRQVSLVLRVLPHVAAEGCFALKGGTAINLFIRDLPRLSVDIDLAYQPIAPRAEALAMINMAMQRIAERLRMGLGAQVQETKLSHEDVIYKLVVRADGVQAKVEVTPVLRGSVFKPESRTVSPSVEDTFGFAEIDVLSFADLFGGKIVAALDRQHPRDLFDIMELLAREGIDDDLRRAFIVYLISHNRPMSEILSPAFKDLSDEFERGFAGMTDKPVTLDELMATRETLANAIVKGMPDAHREFLLSFERGARAPDWALLGLSHIDELPAVRWRQRNLACLEPSARAVLVKRLEQVLGH